MQHPLKHRKFKWIMASLVLLLALGLYPPFRSQAQQQHQARPGAGQDTTRRKSAAAGNTGPTYGVLQAELEQAMQRLEADMKRFQELELPRVKADMERALQEADAACKEAGVAKALAAADRASLQRDLEEATTRLREEMEQNRQQMEASLKAAAGQMKQAREELHKLGQGLQQLQQDGIVNEGDRVDIDWDGDVLVVNGKRQSPAVSKKYAAFFRRDAFTIQNTPPGHRQ